MGISFILKSGPLRPAARHKVALVLAGGAISGGAFKLGGLVALNRFLVGRKVTEFDIYVGLSAGAFIGSFIAGGISPEEVLRGMDGTSGTIEQFKVYDFYWPAAREWVRRASWLAKDAVTVWPRLLAAFFSHVSLSREAIFAGIRDFVRNPSYTSAEKVVGPLVAELSNAVGLPYLGRYVPSGIFDSSRIEAYIRRNLQKNNIPNDFRMLQRERGVSLYITATNLNTARGVVFGPDADYTVSISQAVQASSAVPGFYVPPRIAGEEYLDGGVRKTANASLAMHKGADLIILYNPLRPFMNRTRYQLRPTVATVSDMGMETILNQSIRTLLQTRLYLGLEKLRLDPSFHGDAIVIEPTESDAEFFSLNPLAFWNRRRAAIQGYNSVRRAIEQNYSELQRILGKYGLECDLENVRRPLLPELEETWVQDGAGDVPYVNQSSATRLRLLR